MPSPAAYAALRAAVERHARACADGDLPGLRATLHPAACVCAVSGESAQTLDPGEFCALVAAHPTDRAAYRFETASLTLSGRMACATLVEDGLMGANYLSYLHLVRSGAGWQVTARLMTTAG